MARAARRCWFFDLGSEDKEDFVEEVPCWCEGGGGAFPGGPVASTTCSQYRGPGFDKD